MSSAPGDRATIRPMGRIRRGVLGVVRLVAPGVSGRVLGWGTVAALVGTFFWAHPVSPLALWRADVLLGHGRPAAAAQLYDAVARFNPMPGLRARALERAASTWAVELSTPREARRRLERRLAMPMTPPERAALLERVGQLLLEEGRPADAAVRLRQAHDLAPTDPGATSRLARAARAAAQAGDPSHADQLWRRLGRMHPEWLARAELGRGNLALRQGRVEEALSLYEKAVDHAFDPDVASVARLGAATCLERLGDLQEALAELDEAELPPEVRERRAQRIQDRAALR